MSNKINQYENKINLLNLEINNFKEVLGKTKEYLLLELETNSDKYNQIKFQNENIYSDLISFLKNENVTIAIPLTIVVAIVIWIILSKTRLGYELKATGSNKNAARYAGMAQNRNIILTLVISGALAGLRVSLEAYPELKANQNFLQLQNELSDIENKLSAARRFFNSATRELNNACEVLPSNIVAGMFGFKRVPMYEATENRETLNKAPEVHF